MFWPTHAHDFFFWTYPQGAAETTPFATRTRPKNFPYFPTSPDFP